MGSSPGSRIAAVFLLLSLCACSASSDSGTARSNQAASKSSAAGTASPTEDGDPSADTPPADPAPGARTDDDAAASTYRASVQRIGPDLRTRMRFSHDSGCPVALKDLRYLRMRYADFDSVVRTGEMIVHKDHAEAVTRVFEELFEARWPIRRMRLVDDYRGDDDRSMAANNTSAYNCRRVQGSTSWSRHAYGSAIDINPVQNPYVTDSSVSPPAGERFATIDRSRDAKVPVGAVRSGGVVVRAFERIGWEWGGNWVTTKDYQHFSATGR